MAVGLRDCGICRVPGHKARPEHPGCVACLHVFDGSSIWVCRQCLEKYLRQMMFLINYSPDELLKLQRARGLVA